MSERGGLTREQFRLIGVQWPPATGWKTRVLGTSIDDEAAQRFISLRGAAKSPSKRQASQEKNDSPRATFWVYLLELTGQNYYVGITRNVDVRFAEHRAGAAGWTSRYPPIKVVRRVDTGVLFERDAQVIEDEVTLQTMELFGRDRVRGGKFCALDQNEIDRALLANGSWSRIERAALDRQSFEREESWNDALDRSLACALVYYSDSTSTARDEFFLALYGLTRSRFWRTDFDACLDPAFWDVTGILPVLLSFRHRRPVASKLENVFAVLAAAMTRTRRNGLPFHHLFVHGFNAFLLPASESERLKLERWTASLPEHPDRRYDGIAAVLFPQMRHMLRSSR